MINIAILGTNFGKHHAKLFKEIEESNVETIFGRRVEKLTEIGNQLGINTATNLDDILSNDNIDLVDICLPSEIHKEYAIKCLDAKKHVFCETPLTLSYQDALEIHAAARRNHRNVFVDQFIKFSGPHKFAIELVKNEKKKSPVVFTCYNKTAPVWGDLSVDKSLFMFFIHNIDFLVEIMGYPSGVFAYALDQQKKSSIFSGYKYPDKIASVTCLSNLPDKSPFQIGYELILDDLTLSYSGSYGIETEERIRVIEDANTRSVSLPAVDEYKEAFKHVVDCMHKNEKSRLIDIEIAMESIRLIEETKMAIEAK